MILASIVITGMATLQSQWLTIIFMTGKLAEIMKKKFTVNVWVVSVNLISAALVVADHFIPKDIQCLVVLTILVLAFFTLLRFAFNLSNYEHTLQLVSEA